ncbi:GGDEF domain-containing protein [Pseudarthrobacter sp. AB1]|nr:GGDEF domain-containing protein [Pseudarthrobacter sp. AB1]
MKALLSVLARPGRDFFRRKRCLTTAKDGVDTPPAPVSHALLARALDTVSESSLITDAEQRIIYANNAFTAVSGYSGQDVMGRNCRFLQGPGSDALTVAALRMTLARGETFRGEILNYRMDGTPFWNALTVSPLRDGDGTITHFVSVQRDVTAQKSLRDRLRFLALHDPVTGLPNRTALDRHLSELARRHAGGAGHAAVGVIDLDDFKPVNDTYGHEAGDALLMEFARRLRLKMRETDFLARLGGDEFVIVIEDLDPDAAQEQLGGILARLHEAVDTAMILSPTVSVQIRMSLGLALCSVDSGDAVLRRADAVLYDLKSCKANRDLWWQLDSMAKASPPGSGGAETVQAGPNAPVPGTGLSAQALRDRLFTGGLQMYFQPVMDLRNEKIHLFEALARLCLEDGTILPPGSFLPRLNQGDIAQLFRDGLHQTLKQLADWDRQGNRLRASVNLHPSTLLNPECPHWVASALERHNIAPHRLILELLEAPVEDRESQRRIFDELLALGVGMAQDDLGSGHSSIRRLTALAFDTVKIDHKITAQLSTSPITTLTFLASMITMGQDMGWQVIVEGLEDSGATEAATILGVPYGQGYHLGRPMPAKHVLAWISAVPATRRQDTIGTFLGALTFHWQFVRLGSPHPGPLEACPLTGFLAVTGSAQEAKTWHHQQHSSAGRHLPPSRQLLQWLTERVTGNCGVGAGASTGGRGSASIYPGNPEFFVLPSDL